VAGDADPAKKRRRRGGRGRKRSANGEQGQLPLAEGASASPRHEVPKPERKPRRERVQRTDTSESKSGSENPPAPGSHRKVGFFNRIASFFGRH
jgi:hypothetical protein